MIRFFTGARSASGLAGVAGAVLLAVASGSAARAQSGSSQVAAAAAPAVRLPVFSLERELKGTLDLRVPDAAVGESSSVSAADGSSYATVATLEPVALGADPSGAFGGGQPPPYRRRRYGSPNRSDRGHNADGSNKIAFVAGAGFTMPVGSTGKRLNLNYALKGGAGINLSRKLGILGEFNFDRFGLQGREIANQYALYSSLGVTDSNGNPASFAGLDATSYIWSITANPIFTFAETQSSTAYVVVGGGLYHRVVNFTLPQTQIYQDPYYGGIYSFQQNQTFDHYANNNGGVNAGIGFTHKLGRFSNERIFAEARYVYVFNGKTASSQASLYPPANFSTSYIPVTVGLRW